MGSPIVYEEPSPIGAALEGLGAYGQEQQRRKEAAANLKLSAAAEAARAKEAAANLALNTRSQTETERHDQAAEADTVKTREDAITERYYQANQTAYAHQQTIIEDHWKTLATLYERHIEYLGRMKMDAAKVQEQYAAAQLRYSADMSRLATMAADTKANNETRIQSTAMQIQGRLDQQYNALVAGMGKTEYQAIEQAARATGSSIDPNTGLPTNYDPNYTPSGGNSTQIVYAVPPGYINPATGQGGTGGGGSSGTGNKGGGGAAPAAATSFKTVADKALAAVQGGQMTAQQVMQQLVASKTFKALSPADQQRWYAGMARILGINAQPGQ